MKLAFLAHGWVHHSRQKPQRNSFRYPVFTLNFNCKDELIVRSFLKKRFHRVLSIQSTDFLHGKNIALQDAIEEFLKTNCHFEADEIWLQTFPRMFGYVFNPINFWFCRSAGQLQAVLCEVNNTFGERHFYWIPLAQTKENQEWIAAEKIFHVSPFFPVEGYYKFRFSIDDTRSRVDINYFSSQHELQLVTWVEGHFVSLQESTLFSVLRRYGWMTVLVVLRIHIQAIRLLFKKAKFHRKPGPPKQEISS